MQKAMLPQNTLIYKLFLQLREPVNANYLVLYITEYALDQI